MSTQGGEANGSGQFLERVVENEARARSFHVTEWRVDLDNYDLVHPRRLIRRVPYTSIYGCNSTSEFVLVDDLAGRRVRIECRWQQAAGSVDEKMPYLFLNADEAMPEHEIVLLLAGDGARDEAIAWLKNKCRKCQTKTILVQSIPEFRQWFSTLARHAA